MEMPEIGRREALIGAAAIAVAGIAAPAFAKQRGTGINDAAAAKGRRFGSAVSWSPAGADAGSFANPAYAKLLKRDCGLVVPENELKWQATRPGPDQFNFDHIDAIVGWAKKNAIAVRGHTLLWHRPKWFPGWLNDYDFGARPATEAARLLTTHIDTVIGRYGDTIHGFDVVNEAVDPDTALLVETSLSKAMGGAEATLDLAFRTARAAAPGAQLVYNDYMSWEPGNEKHRAGVLKLLEGFRRRDVPVDALGIQSHIEIKAVDAKGVPLHDEAGWRAFIDAVTAMGYKLVITELDVKDNALPADIAVRDAGVASFMRGYLDLMLDYRQLGDVLAWGMCDRYSWLQGFSPRDDKLPLRCCPYDRTFKPKPIRDALIAAFNAAPAI